MQQQIGLLSVKFDTNAITTIDYGIVLKWIATIIGIILGLLIWAIIQAMFIYGGFTMMPEVFFFAFFWGLLGLVFIRKLDFKKGKIPKFVFTFDVSRIDSSNTTVIVESLMIPYSSSFSEAKYQINYVPTLLIDNSERISLQTSRYGFKKYAVRYAESISEFYNIPIILDTKVGDDDFRRDVFAAMLFIIIFFGFMMYFGVIQELIYEVSKY